MARSSPLPPDDSSRLSSFIVDPDPAHLPRVLPLSPPDTLTPLQPLPPYSEPIARPLHNETRHSILSNKSPTQAQSELTHRGVFHDALAHSSPGSREALDRLRQHAPGTMCSPSAASQTTQGAPMRSQSFHARCRPPVASPPLALTAIHPTSRRRLVASPRTSVCRAPTTGPSGAVLRRHNAFFCFSIA